MAVLPIGTLAYRHIHALFLRLFEQLFPLLNGFFNRTHIQESLFGQIIHLAIQNHTETFDRIFYGDHHTGYAGKLFGYGERLRKEPLYTTCTIHKRPVFIRKFFHTQNRNDILQLFVTLKNLFYPLCHFIMLLPHDMRIENT